MLYIVIDLEWNTGYNRRTGGFINEIIEIGAVMFDGNVRPVSQFTQVVRPAITRKLTGRVKTLTHMDNETVRQGLPLGKALEAFEEWLGDGEYIFMSWSLTDLHVLMENLKQVLGTETPPRFIKRYMDAQRYCMEHLDVPKSQQISLQKAAELFEIDTEQFNAHRGLDDSLVTMACIGKCFDAGEIMKASFVCSEDYFARMRFKSVCVTDIKDPRVDRSKMICRCAGCGNRMIKVSPWQVVNKSFRASFYCRRCDRYAILLCTVKTEPDGAKTRVRRMERKKEAKQGGQT